MSAVLQEHGVHSATHTHIYHIPDHLSSHLRFGPLPPGWGVSCVAEAADPAA